MRKARFVDFERYVENCSRILAGLERLRTGLMFECRTARHEYMDEAVYEGLLGAVSEIGKAYRKRVAQLVNAYYEGR